MPYDLFHNVSSAIQKVQDLSLEQRLALASSKNALPEILQMLSRDREKNVRRQVALNAATHSTVLEHLASDADSAVRLYARSRLQAHAWRSATNRVR